MKLFWHNVEINELLPPFYQLNGSFSSLPQSISKTIADGLCASVSRLEEVYGKPFSHLFDNAILLPTDLKSILKLHVYC